MKKLMIAAAIVCAAAMSQAAVWNWTTTGTSGKNALYNSSGSKLYIDAQNPITFYLFDAATKVSGTETLQDQAYVLNALRDGTATSLSDFNYVKTTTLPSNSVIAEKGAEGNGFAYGTTGQDYQFWMAALVGDEILISDTSVAKTGTEPTPTDIAFSNVKTWSSKAGFGDADWATGNQGWYNASATPEPTSGLLLLLGVAGLALRRRRA